MSADYTIPLTTVMQPYREKYGPMWRCAFYGGTSYLCEGGCQERVYLNPEWEMSIYKIEDATEFPDIWPQTITVQHGERPEARMVYKAPYAEEGFLTEFRRWVEQVHVYEEASNGD
jgi:hypothetical protein